MLGEIPATSCRRSTTARSTARSTAPRPPPSLSTDLDFFLTNLETEIESDAVGLAVWSRRRSCSSRRRRSVQERRRRRRRRRRRQPQGLGAVGGRGDPQLRRVEGAEVARDRGDAPRPLGRRGAQPLGAVPGGGRAANSGGVGADAAVGVAAAAAPRQPNPKREQRQSWTAEEDVIISQSVGAGQPVEPHRDAAAQPHRARDPQPVAPPPADGGGRRRRCRRRRVYRGARFR